MSRSVTREELQEYLNFFDDLAEKSGEIIRPLFRAHGTVEDKGNGPGVQIDPVTKADRDAEQVIRDMIAARFPDDAILGEEFGESAGTSGLVWVIDPIDGTRSFIAGLPIWGTLVALSNDEGPIIGMVDQPILGERFYGHMGGAFLNGEPIETREVGGLSEATLMCTDPGMMETDGEIAAFDEIAECVRMRRYSGDCYGYCMLAYGFSDVLIESGLKVYDIQALIPIVEGAGGSITDWQGRSAAAGGRILASGCRRVHDEALAILSQVP